DEARLPHFFDRRLQRERLLGDHEDLLDLVRGHLHLLGHPLGEGLLAEVLEEFALYPDQLVDPLDHVYRNGDGSGLVGDRPGDGLADPPGGVGGELVALLVVELLDRPDKAEVALLDQVEEQHAAAQVSLGEGDDEAQVRLDELALGDLTVPDDAAADLRRLVGRWLATLDLQSAAPTELT